MHSYYTRQSMAPDGTYVLSVGGELDLHASPRLEAGIEAALTQGARALQLNLSETTFIDSTAIGVLVRAHRRLDAAGVKLEVVCDQPNVLRIFEITRLDQVLPIRSTPPGEDSRGVTPAVGPG